MRSNEDFSEEIRAHLAIEADRLRAEGMSVSDAEAAARKAFGNVTGARERYYESRRWMWFERLTQDVRYALRSLRHSPGFAITAILSLALGIGANTAIFSLVDAVILRMLPVKAPEQLYEFKADGGSSYPEYQWYRDHNAAFTGILASGGTDARDVRIGDGASERVNLNVVSGNFFEVLGAEEAAGRLFGPSDDEAGAAPGAVLSYSYWRARFALDPSAIGSKIRIGNGVFTVLGIAAKSFFGETVGHSTDAWIPLQTHPLAYPGRQWLTAKNMNWLRLIGRLKPGMSASRVAAPFTILKRQWDLQRVGPDAPFEFVRAVQHEEMRFRPANRGLSSLRDTFTQPLWVLLGVSGLVLLIACANVAGLLLARAGARQREIRVRQALGAGRGRLMRQLLTESALLAGCGGALGLVVAFLVSRGLLHLGSTTDATLALQIGPDLRMLAFTLGVSLITGILFGVAPAWRASRSDPNPPLNGNRQSRARATRSRLGPMLVSAQVALSMVVLLAAGLLVRTLQNLRHIDTGFTPERLLVADVDPTTAGYSGAAYAAVCERLTTRLSRVPGVKMVTFSGNGLFQGRNSNTLIAVDNQPSRGAGQDSTYFDVVGPRYFTTTGVPLLRGRDFDERDRISGKAVAIVNEDFANFWLRGVDPIGHRIVQDKTEMEIIGVARDVRDHYLRDDFKRYFFKPYYQVADPNLFSARFIVRTAANPARVASLVRQAIRAEDKTLPIVSIVTAPDLIDRQIVQERLIATLSGWFATLALALAAVGLYGLLAYRVVRRTSEIGVRMALGARSTTVLNMVLGESLGMVLAGIAVGAPLGLAGCRELKSLLFGLSPTDASTTLMAIAGMIIVGLLAAFIPARRASRIDPTQALRYE